MANHRQIAPNLYGGYSYSTQSGSGSSSGYHPGRNSYPSADPNAASASSARSEGPRERIYWDYQLDGCVKEADWTTQDQYYWKIPGNKTVRELVLSLLTVDLPNWEHFHGTAFGSWDHTHEGVFERWQVHEPITSTIVGEWSKRDKRTGAWSLIEKMTLTISLQIHATLSTPSHPVRIMGETQYCDHSFTAARLETHKSPMSLMGASDKLKLTERYLLLQDHGDRGGVMARTTTRIAQTVYPVSLRFGETNPTLEVFDRTGTRDPEPPRQMLVDINFFLSDESREVKTDLPGKARAAGSI